MAGLLTRLAWNGSTTLKGTPDPRQLEAKGYLFLITIEAILYQSSGHSVKTITSFSSGCYPILYTFFNHSMLAVLVL
jgi:hypothetical protein